MESGPPEPPDLEPLHSDPPEPPALGLLESSHPGFETPTLWCFRNTHLGTSEVKSSRTTGFVSSRTTGFEITALGSFRTTRLGTTGIKFSRTTGHGSSRTSGLGTTVLSTVRCTKHYWKLNVATMEYVNPPDSFMQDELEAVLSDTDGSLELVELNPPDPWTAEPREAQELHDGEITTWDEGLAVTAQAWARFCVFKHNIHLGEVKRMHPIFTSVGENIWAGAPYSSFKPESAVKLWVDEVRDYHYDTNQCTKVCGHYTQVVWADSYKVGCAAQACPNGVAETRFSTQPGVIFVCNYATAGNYRGVSPYRAGASCSSCGRDTCENNLCRNSTRDAPQRYNWNPDWDPALSSCTLFCRAVVIIRLISIPIMFASVYCLQGHYKLFAYE
ncbi:GLIPR1 1 [Labeo rohita]|uniref:GLIPR1 1 n=1 Tax=Labeo rohita TaxID=84645 RepID=A0A498P3C7_LABRO|nr:GLIPR1 1 [Labeo rohita]